MRVVVRVYAILLLCDPTNRFCRDPRCSASVDTSTSGLVSAILGFPLPVWRDDIVLGVGHIVTGDPENIGCAVETAIRAAQ
jgi:hypothetical protein